MTPIGFTAQSLHVRARHLRWFVLLIAFVSPLVMSGTRSEMEGASGDRAQETLSPPSEPLRGYSREGLIQLLRSPDAEVHLPIFLGQYSPEAMVQKEGERWVIRALVEDEEAVRVLAEAARSRGESFMPEDAERLRHPGDVIVEADGKEAFIDVIRKMRWTLGNGM